MLTRSLRFIRVWIYKNIIRQFMMKLTFLQHKATKLLVFLACLFPLGWILWKVVIQVESPDPAKTLVDMSGIWALRFLWLCLLLTPLRLLTHDSGWIRFRRMIGLFAFFYATVHVCSYWFLLFGADWSRIWHELEKRPYIMAGLAAWLTLLPLAITSTRGWQHRLGRRWGQLHKLVYLAAFLAITHFTWLEKLGIKATKEYALVLLVLLAVRIFFRFRHSA